MLATNLRRGGSGKSFTFLQHASMADFYKTIFSATAVNIGAPAANRRVILTLFTYGTTTITSVVIGGIVATVHATSQSSGSYYSSHVVSAIVPTGTTADVTVTMGGMTPDCQFNAYRAENMNFSTIATDNFGTTANFTITTVGGGAVVAACSFAGSNLNYTGNTGFTSNQGPFSAGGSSMFGSVSGYPTSSGSTTYQVAATGGSTTRSVIAHFA